MRESVSALFLPFTVHLEGKVPTMYLDRKRLVTVGIGNLIDPAPLALRLPFVHRAGGGFATPVQIADEWARVKAHPDLITAGWRAYEKLCTLQLTDAGISELVAGKLAQNEAELERRFPEWAEWPADAQLAILSLAWACGADFHFPRCEAALHAQDFATAAEECRADETDNPGIVPRNVANRIMLHNAATVLATGGDREVMHYPAVLSAGIPTVPELPIHEETRDVDPPTSEDFPGGDTGGTAA